MHLEKFKELTELNEKIYQLKLKKVRYEEQKNVFDKISLIGDELDKLNFVNDFIVLISQNLKKMSALTLALMNQAEESNSSNCVFKLEKELKSILIEFLQRIINFSLKDNQNLNKSEIQTQLDEKLSSEEIMPVYDYCLDQNHFNTHQFVIKKIEVDFIKDENEKKMLNEIAQDFYKIFDQLEKFNKILSK